MRVKSSVNMFNIKAIGSIISFLIPKQIAVPIIENKKDQIGIIFRGVLKLRLLSKDIKNF